VDSLVMMAREAHRNNLEHVRLAGHYREQRDWAIRRLYSTGGFSYTSLARQTGLSRELIAKIVQRTGLKC
jgi:hypothetical protein